MTRTLTWYLHRLRRMSPDEIAGRVGDRVRQARWARLQVRPGDPLPELPDGVRAERSLPTPLPDDLRDRIAPEVRARIVGTADRILHGEWSVLSVPRPDVTDPDWFLDPVTGTRAPQATYAFAIDHRDESVTGNVKQVWELSRHHHLTVLAAAWWLTREDRYAEAVATQLGSWWAENPYLSGIHWTSGIELGVRLVSWAWIRRFLDGWPGVDELFGDDAVRQIWWHQRYLAAFRSRGSSANNHVIAEEVGRLVAGCVFPWYAESTRWREDAARSLTRELAANTFPDGLNRELATDYHRFVTELGLVAAVEADAAGHPLGLQTWVLLARSLDAAAAVLDRRGQPPRQGDGDEGRALVVDGSDPWAELLAAGAAVVGRPVWWPVTGNGLLGPVLLELAHGRRALDGRPRSRPDEFPDAGLTLLRTPAGAEPEIWCRLDGGPHGFLSIAAHGHADALSLEVRHDGVEVLVDPGTYCYHGEPEWRSYFRSTLAHNTVEIDGVSQSVEAGPFLWERHARTHVDRIEAGRRWVAHHDGYDRLGVGHRRDVVLDGERLTVTDLLTADRRTPHIARLAFHLGPAIEVDLSPEPSRAVATLTWPGHRATLLLPAAVTWSLHRGETSPALGWYSPNFGIKVPTTTVLGQVRFEGDLDITTELRFTAAHHDGSAVFDRVVKGPVGG